jgi:hypothetical protein
LLPADDLEEGANHALARPQRGRAHAFGRQPRPQHAVVYQQLDGRSEGVRVTRRHDEAVLAVAREVADPAAIGRHGGAAARHRLERRQSEPFTMGGEHEHVAAAIERGHLVFAGGRHHATLDAGRPLGRDAGHDDQLERR